MIVTDKGARAVVTSYETRPIVYFTAVHVIDEKELLQLCIVLHH